MMSGNEMRRLVKHYGNAGSRAHMRGSEILTDIAQRINAAVEGDTFEFVVDVKPPLRHQRYTAGSAGESGTTPTRGSVDGSDARPGRGTAGGRDGSGNAPTGPMPAGSTGEQGRNQPHKTPRGDVDNSDRKPGRGSAGGLFAGGLETPEERDEERKIYEMVKKIRGEPQSYERFRTLADARAEALKRLGLSERYAKQEAELGHLRTRVTEAVEQNEAGARYAKALEREIVHREFHTKATRLARSRRITLGAAIAAVARS